MSLFYPTSRRDASKALTFLILCEIIFCAIYLGDFLLDHPSWWIYELFNIDLESNIPTWFSTMQLFLIGFTFLHIGYRTGHTPPPSKLGTKMDEAAIIHEKLTWVFINNPLVPYFDGRHGVWIVVYGCIAIILLIVLYKDLWAMWKSFRQESRLFMLGMFIFLFGAAGMETLTFFFLDKTNLLHYTWEVIFEEFFEMSGVSLMLYSTLLVLIKKTGPKPSA